LDHPVVVVFDRRNGKFTKVLKGVFIGAGGSKVLANLRKNRT